MLKQKVTILLVGLMCFSSISGFFTVICRGFDGHIAVEPVVHNHYECPESGETGNQDKFAGFAIDSCNDHEYCTDSIATLNIIIFARKNVKFSSHVALTANFALKSFTSHTQSVFGGFSSRSYELSSFYAPLRTVILLA